MSIFLLSSVELSGPTLSGGEWPLLGPMETGPLLGPEARPGVVSGAETNTEGSLGAE